MKAVTTDPPRASILSFLQDRGLLWPGYILGMCLLSAIYFTSLKDHGLNIHDRETFHDNEAISEDFSYFFSLEKRHPSGRPFAELVKFLAYLAGGNDPGFFHLLVVAAHGLAAVLLGLVAWRMGTSLATGLVSGLLFLVNVTHFEVIHHISALDYPLALGCGLGAILAYLRYLSTSRLCWLAGFYAGLIVGLMAHMSVVVVLPFCFYWSWGRGYDPKAMLRSLLPLVGLIAIELAFLFFITSRDTSTWKAVEVFSEGDSAPVTMGRTLLLLLSRLPTTAHWLPMPFYKWHSWELFAGAATLGGLALLMWWKRSPASVWSLWVLLFMLPFVLIHDPILFERPWTFSRYLYMATAGASVLLAWGLEAMTRRFRYGRPYLYATVLVGICISSYVYLKRSEAISLYSSGRNYITRGDLDTGIEQLKRAIDQGRDAVDLEDAYERICYMGMGKEGHETVLDEALAAFPNSLALNTLKLAHDSMKPNSLLSSRARKQLEVLRGQDAQASIEVAWGKRIVLNDKETIQATRRWLAGFFHNTGHNLGTGSATLEDLERAILAYRRALELDPDRMVTYEALVTALLASAGGEAEAVRVAAQAVERSPEAPAGLLITASFGLLASKRAEEAIVHCHRALSNGSATEVQSGTVFKIYGKVLDGEYGEVSSASATRMGMDLLDGGRGEEAAQAFRQALDRDAANSQAHFGLALALLAQGQVEEGEQLYAEGVERFGAAREESSAAEGLRRLIARGVQAEAARAILATHWPEQ